MPNWAYNNEVIYGPKKEIESLHKNLINWTSVNYEENGFGLKWIGNIVLGAGFKVPKEFNPLKPYDVDNLPCRGDIIDDFEVTDCDNDFAKITFSSETAWCDVHETWDIILKKHAPNCKYYYMTIEQGMGLFFIHDCDQAFFPYDYHVEVYDFSENKKKTFSFEPGYYNHEDLVYELQKFLKSDEEDLYSLISKIDDNIEAGRYGDPNDITFAVNEFEKEIV